MTAELKKRSIIYGAGVFMQMVIYRTSSVREWNIF